ncbi:MAG: ABC transporter permease [Oscillospiraceae bacterium]|jgi:ABC-2 type transport system permease protein|nr:ABC transporter permease [Oscillospiraceae bacterium]
MKQVLTAAAFTFKDGVRKKAFIITNIILMLVVLVACILLPKIGSGGGDLLAGENSSYGAGLTCFLLDETGNTAIPNAELALQSAQLRVTALDSPLRLEGAKAHVRENDDAALVRILPGEDGVPLLEIYTKSMMSAYPTALLIRQLNDQYRAAQLAAYGVPDAAVMQLLPDLPLQTEYVGNDNISNMVAGGALMFLMFFAIYYYGMAVAMSVATEKSSRVMETLLVSAKPGRILLGKCLGSGALGFLQFTGLLVFSVASAKLLLPAGDALPFQLPDLSLGKALLILLYFILGYALFAMLNSVCGAMVSKMEDINSAMMPVNLITVASFYGGYFANLAGGLSGGGSGGKLMLLIPFTSPFAVPYQLLSEAPDAGLLAGSLALLLAAIALVSFISMRVYAASVLHYGERLKWKDLARMVGRK